MTPGDRVTRVTCTHDCPDACAMLVTVRDGRAVDVAPNPAHPVTGRQERHPRCGDRVLDQLVAVAVDRLAFGDQILQRQ